MSILNRTLPILLVLCAMPAISGMSWAAQSAAPSESGATDEEAIVARVGDEVITREEFQQTLDALRRGPQHPEMDLTDQMRLLEQMIKTEVLYVLARQTKVTVAENEVQEEITNIRNRVPSPDAFEKYLEARHITQEEFADSIRKRLMTQKFVERKTEDLTVTEEELTQEYNRAKQAGQLDVADVSHILVRVSEGTPEAEAAGKEKIAAARERIIKGEDFAAVAREVSEDPGSAPNGGQYVRVTRGAMVPEFDKLMFEIPLNEVSEPFRTQFGWHILKVSSRGTLTQEDTKDRARELLLRAKKMKRLEETIDEAKKNIKIEIMLTSGGEDAGASPDTQPEPSPGGQSGLEQST